MRASCMFICKAELRLTLLATLIFGVRDGGSNDESGEYKVRGILPSIDFFLLYQHQLLLPPQQLP